MDLPDLTLRYGGHADAVIDVHLPAAPGPTIVLLHGGFWKQAYDREYTRPMARTLADLGYVVTTPEYRRVGGGGGWPVTFEDVRTALSLLPELLRDAGQRWQAPVVVGHSAGGQLALLAASAGLPVTAVVALAPVADLRAATELGLGTDAVAAFLAGADPGPADPMQQPPQDGVRVEIVHGRYDDDVPIALSRTYARAHPATILTELDCGHFEPVTPGSIAWPAVVRAVAAAALSG